MHVQIFVPVFFNSALCIGTVKFTIFIVSVKTKRKIWKYFDIAYKNLSTKFIYMKIYKKISE